MILLNMNTRNVNLYSEIKIFKLDLEINLLEKPLQCNSYFNIPKYSTDNLKKYNFLLFSNKMKLLLYLLVHPFLIIARILRLLLLNTSLKKRKMVTSRRIEHLFVSHTVIRESNKENDLYFGHFPSNLEKNGNKILISYIEHVKVNEECEEFKFINAKLTFLQVCNYLYLQFFDGIKIIRIIKFNDIFKLKKLIFYFKTIEHQFSSATFHNIVISRKIVDFCIINEVDFLHLTFEGNAFEEYTVFLLQGKKTQIRMHQFSLITSGHIGIHRFLLNDFSNLIIYCSGPIINDYLKSITTSNSEVITTGSSKFVNIGSIPSKPENFGVLLLPEGTNAQTLLFIDLVKILKMKFSYVNFTLRAHPDLYWNRIIRKHISGLKKYGIIISDQTLVKDFYSNHVSIFSSSAAGIESMFYGLLPIHFATSDAERDIMNPLSLTRSPLFSGVYFDEIVDKINELLLNPKHELKFKLPEIAASYFAPLVVH